MAVYCEESVAAGLWLLNDTYNQDVDSEAFSHALPDQLVSDLTFPQQSLHPRGFLCHSPAAGEVSDLLHGM